MNNLLSVREVAAPVRLAVIQHTGRFQVVLSPPPLLPFTPPSSFHSVHYLICIDHLSSFVPSPSWICPYLSLVSLTRLFAPCPSSRGAVHSKSEMLYHSSSPYPCRPLCFDLELITESETELNPMITVPFRGESNPASGCHQYTPQIRVSPLACPHRHYPTIVSPHW